MSDNKRYPAIRALGFCTGALLLAALGDGAARAGRVDVIAPKYQAVFGGGPPCQVVLWGSSHTAQGVDPRALEQPGAPVFNLAFHASTPVFYQAFYDDLVTHHGRPAQLLWGVDPLLLKRFAWSRDYAQDSEYWPWPLFLARGSRTVWLNRFALIKQREAFQDLLAFERPRTTFLLDKAYKGYVPVAPTGRPLGPEGSDFPDDAEFVAAFMRLLGQLRADRVPITFFQTPEYTASTGEHRTDNAKLAGIARAFGIPFLNYNGDRRSALNQDASLYTDGQHLNVYGAERFSRRLAADLRAAGLR